MKGNYLKSISDLYQSSFIAPSAADVDNLLYHETNKTIHAFNNPNISFVNTILVKNICANGYNNYVGVSVGQ